MSVSLDLFPKGRGDTNAQNCHPNNPYFLSHDGPLLRSWESKTGPWIIGIVISKKTERLGLESRLDEHPYLERVAGMQDILPQQLHWKKCLLVLRP
jgi:hypothetical protein